MSKENRHPIIVTDREVLKVVYHMTDDQIEKELAKQKLIAEQDANAKVKENTPLSELTASDLSILLGISNDVFKRRLDEVNGINRHRAIIVTDEDLKRYGFH